MFGIRRLFWSVNDLIAHQRNGRLNLNPYFQRRKNAWSPGAKSYFIDTVMRNLPVPVLILREVPTGDRGLDTKYEVVDGQQRIRTLLTYVVPQLLEDSKPEDSFVLLENHVGSLAGVGYDDLPDSLKESVRQYEFGIFLFPTSTSDANIINVFSRLNATGSKLNSQELRNAKSFGDFKTLVYDLSEEYYRYFLDWKTLTLSGVARMQEAELISEIISATLSGISSRSQPRLDALYKDNEEGFKYSQEVKGRFNTIIANIDQIHVQIGRNTKISRAVTYGLAVALDEILNGTPLLLGENDSWKNVRALTVHKELELTKKLYMIIKRKAPENVMNAITRRTTNIMERKIVRDYFVENNYNYYFKE